MKRNKIIYVSILLVMVMVTGIFLSKPCLYFVGEGKEIRVLPASGGMEFSVAFIHSVQKTPVEEYFSLAQDLNEIILEKTRYRSFGVGLPFLEEEGSFHSEEDSFVMENMNRHFKRLSLRTGVGTQLTLRVEGEEYLLYELFKPGSRIDIYIAPRYKQIFLLGSKI